MGNRRKSRELALQALFYIDMSDEDATNALRLFCDNFKPPKVARPFFMKLVLGVLSAKPAIDEVIKRFSSHWKLGRMACADRNILRMAVFELCCCRDIPPKVSINEAIDIGKKFGTEESGAFINGILDSIHQAIEVEGLQIEIGPLPLELIEIEGEEHGESADPSERG
jgi:transcription antitermination protein NusB